MPHGGRVLNNGKGVTSHIEADIMIIIHRVSVWGFYAESAALMNSKGVPETYRIILLNGFSLIKAPL